MSVVLEHKWKLLFLLCGLLFLLFPGLDIAASRHFYEPGRGFYLRDTGLPRMVYRFINHIDMPLLAALSALFIAAFNPGFRRLRPHRRQLGYLLLVYLLGPGLVVNVILKDHMGRARPNRIEAFGGHALFTPPLIPSRECRTNCSFVSGHASMGFFLVSLAFAFPGRRRLWLGTGIAAGAFVGYLRILQGAHFLSDVVFAFFAVYAVAAVTCDFIFGARRPAVAHQPRTTEHG